MLGPAYRIGREKTSLKASDQIRSQRFTLHFTDLNKVGGGDQEMTLRGRAGPRIALFSFFFCPACRLLTPEYYLKIGDKALPAGDKKSPDAD